jgi:hypothetical protein
MAQAFEGKNGNDKKTDVCGGKGLRPKKNALISVTYLIITFC